MCERLFENNLAFAIHGSMSEHQSGCQAHNKEQERKREEATVRAAEALLETSTLSDYHSRKLLLD